MRSLIRYTDFQELDQMLTIYYKSHPKNVESKWLVRGNISMSDLAGDILFWAILKIQYSTV